MFLFGFILVLGCMKSDACSEILYAYDGNCYAACPFNTMNIAGTNQCVKHCPESSPVMSHRFSLTCDKYCPIGYSWNKLTKMCIEYRESDRITNQPTRKQDKYYYLNCFCPSYRPFCYKLHCYKKCPEKTKRLTLNGQHCVCNCPDTHPFTNDNACITKCPSKEMFDYRKTCLSSCPKPLYTNNTTCLESCPSGLVSHEYVCRKQCPTSSPYVLESEAGNVCKEECPATTHIMGYRCKAECPREQAYLFNKTCFSSCPHEAPYGTRLKVSSVFILVCLPTCPYDRVRDGMFCSEGCASDMVVFNQSCVEFCPNNTYFIEARGGKECFTKCPSSHNFTFEGECLSQCPFGTNRINLTNICVRKCTNTETPFTYKTYKIIQDNVGTCLKDCPSNTFYHNFQCVLFCPKSYQYVYNRTCHDACPESLYKMVKSHGMWYNYHEYIICMTNCPHNWFNNGHKCVSQCNTSFIANKTCVNKCPQEMPFSLDRNRFDTSPQRCIYNCPSGKYVNDHICVSSCPIGKRYVLDRECLQMCPVSRPFYPGHHYYTLKECKKSCDLGQLADGFTCGNSCSVTRPVHHNSTCMEKCPQNFPLIQASSKDKECRNRCVDGYYSTEENECVSNCWEKRKQYTLQNKCVKKCPNSNLDEFPYVQDTSKGKECTNRCADGYYSTEEKECVSNCWEKRKQYTLQNKCVKKCPDSTLDDFPYVQDTSKGKECRNRCADGYYSTEEKECVSNCWENRKQYTLHNKCVKKCPDSHLDNFPYVQNTSKGKECRNRCADGYYSTEEKECVSNCWEKRKQYTLQNKCVKKCPDSNLDDFPYVQDTSKGKECRNRCADGYYSTEDKNCVSNCWKNRKQYTLHNKCFQKCPDSHPYHLNVSAIWNFAVRTFYCTKLCENNTLAFNFTNTCIYSIFCNMIQFDGRCVPHCPTNAIQIFNNNKWCFKIDGTTSKILLGLLLLVCPLLGIALCTYCCKLKDVKDLLGLLKREKLTNEEEETCLMVPYYDENADRNESLDTTPNYQTQSLTTNNDETCLLVPYSGDNAEPNESSRETIPSEQRKKLTNEEEETCLLVPYYDENADRNESLDTIPTFQTQSLTTNNDETCLLVPCSGDNAEPNESSRETIPSEQREKLTNEEEETCLLVPYYDENADRNESLGTIPNFQTQSLTTNNDETYLLVPCSGDHADPNETPETMSNEQRDNLAIDEEETCLLTLYSGEYTNNNNEIA